MKSNMIWDKVAGFMQQLRCENLSQKTMVQMPEQKKAKSELERVQIIGEEQMSHMEETERRIIREWIEKAHFMIKRTLNIRVKVKCQNCL